MELLKLTSILRYWGHFNTDLYIRIVKAKINYTEPRKRHLSIQSTWDINLTLSHHEG